MGETDRHPSAEGVPDDDGRLLDLQRIEQIGDPLRVPAEREPRIRKIATATKAGHRRGNHPATLRSNGLGDAAVGVLAERPPVQQHHRHPCPGDAVRGGATLHPRPLVDGDHSYRLAEVQA